MLWRLRPRLISIYMPSRPRDTNRFLLCSERHRDGNCSRRTYVLYRPASLLHQFGHANRMGLARPTDHATDPVIFSQPSPTRVGSARPTDPASPICAQAGRVGPARPTDPQPRYSPTGSGRPDRPTRPGARLRRRVENQLRAALPAAAPTLNIYGMS